MSGTGGEADFIRHSRPLRILTHSGSLAQDFRCAASRALVFRTPATRTASRHRVRASSGPSAAARRYRYRSPAWHREAKRDLAGHQIRNIPTNIAVGDMSNLHLGELAPSGATSHAGDVDLISAFRPVNLASADEGSLDPDILEVVQCAGQRVFSQHSYVGNLADFERSEPVFVPGQLMSALRRHA